MLLSLLREKLVPYRSWLAAVVGLQFVSTVAMLYLPSLNAAIIDDGVTQGDIGEIWRLGGIMLAITLVQVLCAVGAVWFGARTAMAFGRVEDDLAPVLRATNIERDEARQIADLAGDLATPFVLDIP